MLSKKPINHPQLTFPPLYRQQNRFFRRALLYRLHHFHNIPQYCNVLLAIDTKNKSFTPGVIVSTHGTNHQKKGAFLFPCRHVSKKAVET